MNARYYDLKRGSPLNCCDRCCFFHASCYSTSFVKFCALLAAAGYAAATLSAVCGGVFIEPTFFAPAGVFVAMCALALMYARGADLERDGLMIPYVVGELLLKLVFGLIVCILWIAYILATYDQIDDFLIEWELSARDVGAIAAGASLALVAGLRAFFFFHTGYRAVKKLNDRRRMCADESSYMDIVGVAGRRRVTGTPTAV